MKCPLFGIGAIASNETADESYTDCLKERCAWWDKVQNQCSVLSMGDWLENIHSVLSGMEERMSKKGGYDD